MEVLDRVIMTVDEHRKIVHDHLRYIKDIVDNMCYKLDRINGRVRTNEKSISFIKGIGTLAVVIITAVLGWFSIE